MDLFLAVYECTAWGFYELSINQSRIYELFDDDDDDDDKYEKHEIK